MQKLTHWSHSTEIDIGKTVGLWRATTLENYRQLKNFHPLNPPLWEFLEIVDWPPKSLANTNISDQRAASGKTPSTRDNHFVVQGRTADGAMLISFGKHSIASKDTAT